jgi:hypothetical protein
MEPVPHTAPAAPRAAPPVLAWQRAYCVAMALLYVAVTLGGLAMAVFHEELADAETSPGETIVVGLVLAVVGAGLAVGFGVAPFLPRRPWTWVFHVVLIGLGMTSCCCLPATVPLLVFWIRPETRAWFAA